jgi:hypothetical protein
MAMDKKLQAFIIAAGVKQSQRAFTQQSSPSKWGRGGKEPPILSMEVMRCSRRAAQISVEKLSRS